MSDPSHIIIKGAEVWHPVLGCFKKADVVISDGIIQEISEETNSFTDAYVINAEGLHLLPGLVDLHVHFRQPGYEYKETIRSGSEAAARGGFTTVCTMPNLNPAPDSTEHLDIQLEAIEKDAVINVIPYATITRNRMGDELVDYKALSPYVAGFSDDGSGVQSEDVMRRAMCGIAPTGKILAAHCEVNALLKGGYVHDSEKLRARGHKGICSESEWAEIERDIHLAKDTGCRLHICHISTKESVSLIRMAKSLGIPVTCETGPHYLTFCDEDVLEHGRFKMNPPLREEEDRQALRQGVIDGTIDAIATDHAPHSAEEKNKGLQKSAMGVVGLETSLSAIYTTMVRSGLMPLSNLVRTMADNPRRILGLPAVPIAGGKADLTLVDFNSKYTVDPKDFVSKGKSTPFEGMTLYGQILATISGGKFVYRASSLDN